MSKLKLAFIGCGDVAQRDYLPELHRIRDQIELVAVCGRTTGRVRKVAADYGFKTWYTDYEQMLAETDAEAVINLTPMQLHYQTNRAVLASGRHLYTEKTVAGSVAEARELAALAAEHGATFVCAPCVMLWPQIVLAATLLREGAIGPVYSARGLGFGGVPPWQGFPSDQSPFFARGGGPQRDMGVYPLHALTGLLGPARRVGALAGYAQRSFLVPDGPFAGTTVPVEEPDNWHMMLDLGDQRIVAVEANNCARGTRAPELELMGLQGTLALNIIDVGVPIQLQRGDGAWETIDVPRSGRASGPDHLLGIAHLVECVREQRSPTLSIEHALHVVEIIERAAQGAEEGRIIPLETRF
jgi:predicted dehydrogenase